MDNQPEQLSTPFVDGETRPKGVTKWIAARRYVGAFFIYIIYWITLFGAIRNVAGATLSPQEAGELVEEGVIHTIWEYGWGDHYVGYLVVFCTVTFSCGALAGATAKRNGGIVASLSNIPLVLIMILLCYSYFTRRPDCESPIAWGIALPASVLGSVFFSLVGGSKGEQWQNSMFSSNTILGIRPVHWWWLIFPLHLVIQTIIPKIAYTIRLFLGSTQVMNAKYAVLSFLIFVSLATFIYFTAWGWYRAFRLLSAGNSTKPNRCRAVLKVLFYLFGIPLLFDVFCVLILVLVKFA